MVPPHAMLYLGCQWSESSFYHSNIDGGGGVEGGGGLLASELPKIDNPQPLDVLLDLYCSFISFTYFLARNMQIYQHINYHGYIDYCEYLKYFTHLVTSKNSPVCPNFYLVSYLKKLASETSYNIIIVNSVLP